MAQTAQASQKHLNIAQIKNGVVYTRSGGLRAILEVKPVNFALKSEQDQNVIIGEYQNFLNSLSFPLQIIAASRRLDLHPYLKQLQDYTGQLSVELLRLQALDYIDFIKKLTTLANIMDKKFYVVVPYEPIPIQKAGFLTKIFGPQKKQVVKFSPQQLTNYLTTLSERVTVVIQGLSAMQLGSRQLNTQQAIELFYNVYNPEEATEERLVEVSELEAAVIQKSPNQEKTQQKAKEAIETSQERGEENRFLADQTVSKPVENIAENLNQKTNILPRGKANKNQNVM